MAFLQQPSSYFSQASEVSAADLFDTAHQAPLFTPLELAVLRIARTDTLASAQDHGFVRRLFGRLFALPPSNGLADERLEALRRFAVMVRCHRSEAARRLPDFLASGFSRLQAGALASGLAV